MTVGANFVFIDRALAESFVFQDLKMSDETLGVMLNPISLTDGRFEDPNTYHGQVPLFIESAKVLKN